jgi:hypothetical protein
VPRRRDDRDRLIRPLPALLALAVGVGAGVAVASTRSTELGETTSAPVYRALAPVVQFSTTPGTKSYTTPDGVLTSWRYHSGPESPPGTVRLELFKPGVGEGVYEAVAASDTKTLAPDTAYEFSERIPVKQGYVLGLDPDLDAAVAITVSASSDQIYQFGGDVPVGETSTATGPFPTYRVNVAATIEPDADGDAYGDETQDQCPTDASTQGPCPPDTDPPETEITKDAPRRTDKHKVKFKFTSDEPDSTFKCKLDRKQFKRCSSPKTVTRLDEGKHKFKVFATDPAGNSDPSAAKDKFKVVP